MTSTRRIYGDKSYCRKGVQVEQKYYGLPQGFVRKCICNQLLLHILELITNNPGKKIYELRNPEIIPSLQLWNAQIRELKSYNVVDVVKDQYKKNPVYYIKPQYKFGIERILKEQTGA